MRERHHAPWYIERAKNLKGEQTKKRKPKPKG
jgi:hypothetical protein